MTSNPTSPQDANPIVPTPRFPAHSGPRTWFLTAGNSPIAVTLARHLIAHGDNVVAGIYPTEYNKPTKRSAELKAFLQETREMTGGENNSSGENVAHSANAYNGDTANSGGHEPGGETGSTRKRVKLVSFDFGSIGDCQSAVAEALEAFGKIDILFCCNSEALIGTVEELSQSDRTQSLVRDQFAANFFGPVNIIKAMLPSFRDNKNGHILLQTGITGHLGTPGLGIYCASQWAIEGYCDSLAYEIAPFNIKMSIVQSNIEVSVLTNKITAVPPMHIYSPTENPAPLSRNLIGGLLDRLSEASGVHAGEGANANLFAGEEGEMMSPGTQLQANQITSLYPPLPPSFQENLIAETVHALLAIGGHENPPARHIVGHEGVASVKEKLKTVSEELEDFVEVSASVDY